MKIWILLKKHSNALASKYHPDKNNDNIDAQRIFIKITTAYEKIMEFRKNG
jgi:DnaJ-class molecular chaperone